jgi:hypothetical protein
MIALKNGSAFSETASTAASRIKGIKRATIEFHNTPTVCIVVYGNRAYDDALLALRSVPKMQER